MRQQLQAADLAIRTEVPIPITYLGLRVDTAYRADIIVNDSVLLELKAVERVLQFMKHKFSLTSSFRRSV